MFHYAKFDHVNKQLWIVDNDSGGMTVTNDAPNVARYLNEQYPGHRIFYFSADKMWFEMEQAEGNFKQFRTLNQFDLGRCPKV